MGDFSNILKNSKYKNGLYFRHLLHLFHFFHFVKDYFCYILFKHKFCLIMLPFIFRIGPMFIAEVIFLTIGITSRFINQLCPCFGFTFIELSLQLFLLEVIISFHLINKNKELRAKYLGKLIFGTKDYFLKRISWNIFCIWGIMLGLTSWMIKEGLTLANTELENSQKMYTLYPICFFSDLANHPQNGKQFGMVMNFLYICNIVMNLCLIGINIKSFYIYYMTIKRNRLFFKKNSVQFSESLLDCQLINQSIIEEDPNPQTSQGLECGICLRKFCGQKVIKLRCSHYFHEQCINLWLKVKDSCPYRCR